jgi:hypothetical protein
MVPALDSGQKQGRKQPGVKVGGSHHTCIAADRRHKMMKIPSNYDGKDCLRTKNAET